MASLVLGAAGAFVGSFFGPLGTSIGWAVGSGLGNALFAKGQNGPRLTDLKVHNSSYGMMIPIIYGTVRISGIVIWSTDLIEDEQKTGGKGGPEVTQYTYTVSTAIAICEGEIGGLLRIWADSRLVYDAAQSDPDDFPFTLYLGTESQLPDPTMEAEEGAGNVSAHRGMAYIVFTDLSLTDFGNRVPSFTFEVYGAGAPIPWRYSTFDPVNNDNRAGPQGSGPQSGAVEDGRLLLSWITGHTGIALVAQPCDYNIDAYDLDGNFIENVLTEPAMLPPAGGSTLHSWILQCQNNPHVCWIRRSPQFTGDTAFNGFYYDGVQTSSNILDPTGSSGGTAQTYAIDMCPIYWNNAMYGCGGPPAAYAYIAKWTATSGVVMTGLPTASYSLPGTHGGARWSIAVDTVTGHIWCYTEHDSAASYDELFELDEDLNLIQSWAYADWPQTSPLWEGTTGSATWWNSIMFFTPLLSSSSYAFYVDPGGGFTQADTGEIITSGFGFGGLLYNAISLGTGLVLTAHGIISLQPRSEAVTLGSIVENLSVRAGLTTDEVDVTELTDLVDGYVLGNQMDARAAVEPLQVAWPFDAVEHDVLVRFPRRGVDGVQATIDDADLGCYVPPGDPPALMTTQRLQEVDLPRIVDCTFMNLDTDYQNGEARAQRLITTSDLTTALQLPIVMTSQKALSVCSEQLYNAWVERERFGLSLSRKWLLLEPADVIEANGRTMRISRKVEQADGIVRIDALATTLAVYAHLAPPIEGVGMPGGGGTPPTTPPVIQDTDALLLDLPLITDDDNAIGWYAAMAGHTQPAWPGASLYKSVDGGASYNFEVGAIVRDTFGDCSTVLGDFTGGNIFDEVNSITVTLTAGSGTLASVTRLAVLNGANMAVIGTPGTTGIRNIEIIQFREATLTGTRTYLLTGLLRGRRGSEWMIGQHTSGEKFVLLPTSTNVLGLPAELYLGRQYKAVTSGRALSTAGPIDFTNYGIAALPYGPCHLGGGRLVNGDLLLTWERRTRVGGLWTPFVDVPLGELFEEYQLRIYTDATYSSVARLATALTAEYTYTAADQLTDFGSPSPLPVYWGVSQLGTYAWGTETRGAT